MITRKRFKLYRVVDVLGKEKFTCVSMVGKEHTVNVVRYNKRYSSMPVKQYAVVNSSTKGLLVLVAIHRMRTWNDNK